MRISNFLNIFRTNLFSNTVPPRILPFDFEENPVSSDRYVQLTCVASVGDLPMNITWLFNDTDVRVYQEMSTGRIGARSIFLSIDSVWYNNAGVYTCVAQNDVGEDRHSARLFVNGY